MPTPSENDHPPEDTSTLLEADSPTFPRLARLLDTLPADAGLSLAEKRTLLGQARLLLEQIYVHRHLKQALYGIDPVQRLTLLQYRLENAQDEIVTSELAFHRELQEIFTNLHDLHTNYILPAPYQGITTFLPFLLEEYFDARQKPHYIVSKVMSGFDHPSFKPGVEVILWNGLPILEAIHLNGERQAGSNAAARHSVGLGSITIRPLATSLPPNEVLIRLTYLAANGDKNTIEFEWLTSKPSGVHGDMDGSRMLERNDAEYLYRISLMGSHLQTEKINAYRKLLFAPQMRAAGHEPAARSATLGDELETSLTDTIRVRSVDTPSGKFAYLRIFTFVADDPEAFIKEIMRLLRLLPQDGLILDVRGNSGGLINMAEDLLQLFIPDAVHPEQAQFLANAFTRELCRNNAPSPIAPSIDLAPWVPSLDQAHANGALYSTAHPLTDPEEANSAGQIYTGPVVLVTDAQCYSATDMFAAGFQDHRIGKILGVDSNTGAGGANVWTHYLLRVLDAAPGMAANPGLPHLEELPRQADFRVSARRMLRTGDKAGMPLEDFGVEPDERHYMTRSDLLEGNVDLINHAAKLLAAVPRHALIVESSRTGDHCELKVSSKNLDRIDWYIDKRPAGSKDVSDGETKISLPASATGKTAYLEGFSQDERVATQTLEIKC